MAVYVDASVPLRRLSVADYFRMGELGLIGEDERVELLRGAIVEIAPPTPDHDDAIEWLTMRLVPLAIAAGVSVRVQSTIVLEIADSVPMPDLAIVEPRRRDARRHPTSALVAIEVSVSSLRIDTRLKAGLYAEVGIPEYWVVDVRGRRVVRHTLPGPAGYEVVEQLGPEDELRCAAVPAFPVLRVTDVLDGDLGR